MKDYEEHFDAENALLNLEYALLHENLMDSLFITMKKQPWNNWDLRIINMKPSRGIGYCVEIIIDPIPESLKKSIELYFDRFEKGYKDEVTYNFATGKKVFLEFVEKSLYGKVVYKRHNVLYAEFSKKNTKGN